MPTLARPRLLLAFAAALLVAVLLGHAARPPAADAQPKQNTARILVLRGGSPESDTAVIQALQAKGLDVTSGPESVAFEGGQQALRDYDVVVLLFYNASAQSRLTTGGVDALERFVEKGGGLVTGEWLLSRGQLAGLMPAIHCGANVAGGTTYRRVAPSPLVDEGVPASFELSLANTGGSESCLQPRDEATVLYSSSNGGGRRDAAGLVAWNVGQGRVASFSTKLSATELQSAAYTTLFQNTVSWLAATRDTTPPRIKSFTVTGGGGLVGERQVQIELTASDSGGSGLGSYFVREYVYSGNPADGWKEEGASPSWQAYQQPGASVSWTLSARPGVHYLQAFVADRAGNVTPDAAVAIVNYAPAQVGLAQDEIHIYRIVPGAGARTAVRMDALSGNPDLYVFGPGVAFTPESDATPEQTNFAAQSGVYQVEVEGYLAGSYGLSVTTRRDDDDDDDRFPPTVGGARLDRRPRISVLSISPPEPETSPGALPNPPVDPDAASLTDAVFLPLVRQRP